MPTVRISAWDSWIGGVFTNVTRGGSSRVYGINNLGQAVGGDSLGGFIYSAGTYTSVNFPGAPNGINDLGQVVGSYTNSANQGVGFLFSGGTYTTIQVPGATETNATGINNAGEIVGWYIDTSGNVNGFLDIGGVITTLQCTAPFDP
jgi:probable HAF family extracellular repeat protein